MRIVPQGQDAYMASGSCVHVHMGYRYGMRAQRAPDWAFDRDRAEVIGEVLSGLTPASAASCRTIGETVEAAWDRRCTKSGEPFADPISVEREEYATLHELLGARCPNELRTEVVTSRHDLLVAQGERLMPIDWKLTFSYSGSLAKWNPKNNDWVLGAQAALNRAILRVRYPETPLAHFRLVRISRETPHDFAINPVELPDYFEAQFPDIVLRAVEAEFRIAARLKMRGPILRDGALRGVCKPGPKKRPCDFLELCLTEPRDRPTAIDLAFEKKDR
jgi:hypothetical protein